MNQRIEIINCTIVQYVQPMLIDLWLLKIKYKIFTTLAKNAKLFLHSRYYSEKY